MVEDSIEQLLAEHPEEVRRVAREAVDAVQASMPEAVTTVARGWHSVNFRHPTAGYVCGVFPFQDRVDVAFEAGSRLTDPEGLLQPGSTSAKRVRYVRYRPGDDVDREVLDAFVQDSIALLGRR